LLNLKKQNGTLGAILNGGTTSDGSTLGMYNAGGANTIRLDADIVGNFAATLPDSSISSAEMWNEPGIACNGSSVSKILYGTMEDLSTVTITTPAAGYIVVQGKAGGEIHGTRSANFGVVQIDETPGGSYNYPDFVTFGADSTVTTNWYDFPVYVHRIYSKPAGTYTFRVEGMASSSNGVGAVTRCYNTMILATYYSTSYGNVNTLVSSNEREQFDNAVPEITSEFGPANSTGPQTLYRVDLRELELKAARAQAAAERAQRELLEAKLQEEASQVRR